MKYVVLNVYGISGESHHRSLKAAYRAMRRREGEGWIVIDATTGDQVFEN